MELLTFGILKFLSLIKFMDTCVELEVGIVFVCSNGGVVSTFPNLGASSPQGRSHSLVKAIFPSFLNSSQDLELGCASCVVLMGSN